MDKSKERYRSKFGGTQVRERTALPKTLATLLQTQREEVGKPQPRVPSPVRQKVGPARKVAQGPKLSDEPADPPGVEQARKALATFIDAGDVSQAVVDLVFHQGRFIPIEGALLDYKRDLPKERPAQLKLIKHIQSFHNTYGGYLVFGAEELTKDAEIVPVCEQIEDYDFKRLRDLCREYLTSSIEIQARTHTVIAKGVRYQVVLMHIPIRRDRAPVLVRKDAKDSEGKYVLKRDDAHLREGDNSIVASSFYHWRILFGPRENPYCSVGDTVATRVRPIYSDLPDRDFICPDFIGRHDYLAKLFAWLADDFTCVRVLAGEGGLGKTSIAFQFASEVARANLIDAEAVIWLTAKRYQFRAVSNEYEQLINCHFSTSRELFEALAKNLGEVRTDWSEIDDQDFPRLLRSLGQHINVFFVVDDLDSLDIDDQKRCIEVCQQLAGLGSRFLFTTRKNATASTSTAIEVDGLEEDDYAKLIDSWQDRLKIAEISPKDVRRLRETTHGSPLYTESLLRLVKNGMPVGEAISKWKGNLGVEVRNAALKREVTQLGQEARKVLVAAAILGECSLAEIKVATDYSDQTLLDSTNELQSLFLLHAPAIASQPRFSISKTTTDLIVGLGAELIPDFSAFQERIRSKRHKAQGENQKINAVGVAVNQAMALVSAGDPEGALKTVDEVNQSLKNRNKDLWFLRGRVLLKFSKPRLAEAKAAFIKAFDLGQRKALFFGMWYDTALDLEQFEGAVEVATSAIEASAGSKADWLVRRANARLQSAGHQDRRGDTEHTVNQLKQAADDFYDAGFAEPALRWDSSWKESFYRTHDGLWTVTTRTATSVPAWLDAFDMQVRCIERGDLRLDSYSRLKDAFVGLRTLVRNSASTTERAGNLVAQVARRGQELLRQAPKEFRVYRLYREVEKVFAVAK
jgi:tetratricopeptide (TPR) repeat protein